MNLRQSKTEELALLLHGLNAVYVETSEPTRQHLLLQLETELATRGVRLNEPSQVVTPEPARRGRPPKYSSRPEFMGDGGWGH